MKFCTQCGVEVEEGQPFCRNCGHDLLAREAPRSLEAVADRPFSMRGLGTNSEVFLSEEGLLKVRIRSEYFVAFIGLASLLVLVPLYYVFQTPSWGVYYTAWFVLAAPAYEEFKWRGMERLGKLPIEELARRRGSVFVAWAEVDKARLRGRTVFVTSRRLRQRLSATFDEADVQLINQGLASRLGGKLRVDSPRRALAIFSNFPALVGVLFAANVAVLFLAAGLPFFAGEEQAYTATLGTISQTASLPLIQEFQAIFLNNTKVVLISGIPGLGLFSLLFSSYNTGRILQVIAIQGHITGWAATLFLFLFPHTWVEELCYPIATAAGLYYVSNRNPLPIAALGTRLARRSVRMSFAMLGAVFLLVVAGVLEVIEPPLGLGALVLWLPVGVGAFFFVQRVLPWLRRATAYKAPA
ncbi:MAG: stage II sporulation protein M [archaeon]|nr:MAG: stage II sporulation protein M [archaeon]